jgi:uncharacterized membrane protein
MAPAPNVKSTTTRQWLRIVGIVLALIGLSIAAYMSWAEVTGTATSCPGHTEGDASGGPGTIIVDCGFVQNSIYANVFGIPVALIGMGGYLAILAIWILENRSTFLKENGYLLAFGLSLFGFLFTLYLTYTEIFIMYTICTWCVATAIVMMLVFLTASGRMIQALRTQPGL